MAVAYSSAVIMSVGADRTTMSSASGFVLILDGGKFLVTNAHLMAKYRQLVADYGKDKALFQFGDQTFVPKIVDEVSGSTNAAVT